MPYFRSLCQRNCNFERLLIPNSRLRRNVEQYHDSYVTKPDISGASFDFCSLVAGTQGDAYPSTS
jgi:hypothetical protein